jgi:NAD(P)-dependent dehydrogenase (short-subunit alcohol dehydrogenase family)
VDTSRTDGAADEGSADVVASRALALAFNGKTVVITGAGTGIGLATTLAFAAGGAHTYAIVDKAEDAQHADPLVPARCNIQWLVADVRSREALSVAFDRIESERGHLDVLVSNAGVARHGGLTDISSDDVSLMIDTNLIGFLNVMALGVPLLRRAGQGSVVAVSSVHAIATSAQVSVYAATKAAIVGAARAAALDHGPDQIRVNAVLPGSVDTPMLRASAERRFPDDPQQAIADWGSRHPIGRVLTADEVACAILFLAGPAASGITGVALPVDGGLLAKLAL